ncbi:4-hydroxy-3-methylbut-2-enyl diphosphate reductase [Sedimentibacter sp. zth1]|uniref:4-hydroxy-3-methylbut-2-enyl diphosphate reductase n=1 Tax=Sedimentibacter sp. zth1 TaxID=2816908 RepID=UPI001A9189FC|nr:4-hydroxy-3-methylbut-2-enyl diphosphate reductase [Sedimentibacter sp. zth1]QSX06785.1 4-hydroxy-3-methylbut-2-enyl diphosphate reductase [Sedimentibacter sp. zth1]
MEIFKADYMGFCFGVKNAVEIAKKSLDEDGSLISYGEIIHNQDEINFLKEKGLEVVYDLDKSLEKKDKKILIRSHGVPKKDIDFLNEHNIEYVDATCVRVKKIHEIVRKHSEEGYEILIIGNPNHPEVKGISGWIEGPLYCANSLEEVRKLNINRDKKYCLVCQTTFYNNIYKEIVEFFNENDYTNIVRYNTICDATKKRQDACVEIAKKVDVMLVIGGKKSSNTKKLFDLCSSYCINTFLIENYREIPYKYIDKKRKIGITAGASTPDWVIEEVIQYVRQSE